MPETPKNRRIPYFGDFVLFDEIGRGGMGVVYDAQQTKLDRPVALKVLHTGLVDAAAGFQRLRIEAEAAARLAHPNIVPIFEIGEHEGQPYLAMQLVEGESLAERIARLGPVPKEKDAAALMAKIARAIHHAHERGLLHRDLKPGNILIDEAGEPHLIDFGLCKCLERDSGLTRTGTFLGTPAYASPEQAAGQNESVTIASDVYGLGAILYALLTGQPPFVAESTAATIEKVRNNTPLRPRSVRPTLSANLETICLKCLEKEPTRRYPSALALAEDLDRFLDGRPITARQVGVLERLWMWVRRNPVDAALWGIAVLVIFAFITGLFVWREARSRILQRHLLLEQAQRIRLTAHSAGWSEQAWSCVCEAAKIPTTKPGDVRDQAATLLAGLDAHCIKLFTNFGASSVMFDPQGEHLLVGGLGDGATLWDPRRDAPQRFAQTNTGPLAFADDGSPVQLLYDANRRSLILSDLVSSEQRQEWKIPKQIESENVLLDPPILMTLTRSADSAAVVLPLANGKQLLTAFRSNTWHPVKMLSSRITALVISSDGSLIAWAESTNAIAVWSVSERRLITTLPRDRNQVTCLALKQTTHALETTGQHLQGDWALAVGDSGGTVTLWDLRTNRERRFPGGHYGIEAIAFSPDGATLASGGVGRVRLWDVATERELLDLPIGGDGRKITGLDFAPSGERMAVCSRGGNSDPNHVFIWELESSRGVRTLRGLSGQVSRVCFSSDGRRIAALSHNWEVGIWDLASGQLHRVIEVPPGHLADNAAIIFSPDAGRLVFSATITAKMWDVNSGAALQTWELWPGFADLLRFPDEDHLLLLRVETLDGKNDPFRNAPPATHPRVCRIRNLLSQDGLEKPVVEDRGFDLGVFNTTATRDGQFFVVEGKHSEGSKRHMFLRAYDGLTGRKLWSVRTSKTGGSGTISTDATCRFVSFQIADLTNAVLAELSSGRLIKSFARVPSAIGPGGDLYAEQADQGCPLFNGTSDDHPLVTLGIDSVMSSVAQFDINGNQLAWGTADGSVTVCDLKEIQRRLKQVGLQW